MGVRLYHPFHSLQGGSLNLAGGYLTKKGWVYLTGSSRVEYAHDCSAAQKQTESRGRWMATLDVTTR